MGSKVAMEKGYTKDKSNFVEFRNPADCYGRGSHQCTIYAKYGLVREIFGQAKL